VAREALDDEVPDGGVVRLATATTAPGARSHPWPGPDGGARHHRGL